jgi:hypothetical protein
MNSGLKIATSMQTFAEKDICLKDETLTDGEQRNLNIP